VACPTACRVDRCLASFLVPYARQWLAQRLVGWIALRRPSSFLLLVSSLTDGFSDGSLIGLLPCFFRLSVARLTLHRTDRSSASFLVPSARQWLARRLAGWIALQLPSSFLPLVSGLPDGLPGGSLFGFLPRFFLLVSGLPDGYLDASLIGLLHRFFRSSVACPTACRVDRCSASFLVPSARQWLTRRLLGRIAHRLISSFLLLLAGSPDGSLIGLLPRFF